MTIGDWIATLSALATALAAAVGWAAARAARDAVLAGNRQADSARSQVILAQKAAESAAAAATEATRSRIDTRAPVLFVIVTGPSGDPLILREPLDLLSDSALARSRSFIRMDRHSSPESILWFRGRGLVVNEGQATALVRSPDGVRFLTSELEQGDYMGMAVVPARAIETDGYSWAIVPGRSVLQLYWALGRTLLQWEELTEAQTDLPLTLCVEARSVGDIGVVDTFATEIFGSPLEQDAQTGAWVSPQTWPQTIRLLTHTPTRSYGVY